MKVKNKSRWWYFTFPFAHNNYTTIGDTIYCPKGVTKPSISILAHEKIHIQQQQQVGVLKYLALYLLCLPLFYNPWRATWELEAYVKGSGYSEKQARAIISSYQYGWLRWF